MPDYSHELLYEGPVAGVDEAGYGPWAGPVVAAAVILNLKAIPPEQQLELQDSKQLSKKKREALYGRLRRLEGPQCCIGIGQAEPWEIDKINIRQANLKAMARAVSALTVQPATVLVDGINVPDVSMTCHSIVKGDAQSLSIAAASIIAKVTRDRIMANLAKLHPGYGWERNAGYGTKLHQEGLETYGISPHHRKSYKPVRRYWAGA